MRQQFSSGLLYSVAPENLSALHLQDDEKADSFEWEQPESQVTAAIRTLLSSFIPADKRP